MTNRDWLRIAAIGALAITANVALAQNTLRPPPGVSEFPACCDSCPAGGCTGCNSGPQGLSCGKGLVLAECSMKDNKVHCEKTESSSTGGASQMKTR